MHPREDESVDGLLRGKIRVIQSARGYRVSEDALFLVWFVGPQAGSLVLDAGTGCGVIAFGLALKEPTTRVVGLELQGGLADRAARGVRLNRMEHRVLIVQGDVTDADVLFRRCSFDLVVSNPPYHERGSGLLSEHTEKALARHQLMMPPDRLMHASDAVLKPDGGICLIYPADRFHQMVRTMKDSGFEPSRVLWIQPREGARAVLVCVDARRPAQAGDLMEDSLILYDDRGKRTEKAEAILSGEI